MFSNVRLSLVCLQYATAQLGLQNAPQTPAVLFLLLITYTIGYGSAIACAQCQQSTRAAHSDQALFEKSCSGTTNERDLQHFPRSVTNPWRSLSFGSDVNVSVSVAVSVAVSVVMRAAPV